MSHAVRCPSCRQLSRVGADDLGRAVACPHCGRPFNARSARSDALPVEEPPRPEPHRDDIPTVFRVQPRTEEHHPDPIHTHPDAITSGLIGLALLPWGIPLAWLAAGVLLGDEPIFSFAAPVALAVGLSGLGLGIGAAARWSHGAKVRSLLALAVVGYILAGVLFFVKREWAEATRNHFPRDPGLWSEVKLSGAPKRPSFSIRFPGHTRPISEPPLWGWEHSGVVYTDRRRLASDVFVAAQCKSAEAVEGDEWYAAAREALLTASGGELVSDSRVVAPDNRHSGHEYVLRMPDGATSRIVRIFRVDGWAVYLAAQGPFWTPANPDVKTFFKSLILMK